MKLNSENVGLFITVFVTVLLIFTFYVKSSNDHEFPIITYKSDQWLPDIYGNIIVYGDDRNGNWDIYGYDLSTRQEFQITTDYRNGNFDIYGYKLSIFHSIKSPFLQSLFVFLIVIIIEIIVVLIWKKRKIKKKIYRNEKKERTQI